jgi:ADP-ribose 1''-phosphate phosphatase
MAAQRNGSIASYFKPTGEVNSSKKAVITSAEKSVSSSSTKEMVPVPQTKGKGKRQISISPPPTAKRTAMTTTEAQHQKHLAYTDLPTDWLQDPPSPSKDPGAHSIKLTYHKGDIFAAPPHTLLIHACNTQGHWGAGIAKAFKALYPKAYSAHHAFCAKTHNPKSNPVPTGTAQILAPVDGDAEHWIGCVFTSAKYGKAKDKPDVILRNTKSSMEMLLELVKRAGESGEGEGVRTVRMCKINSGKFGVKWERTEEVLKEIVLREGWVREIEVWEPDDE